MYTRVYVCAHMADCFLNVSVCNRVNGSTHSKGQSSRDARVPDGAASYNWSFRPHSPEIVSSAVGPRDTAPEAPPSDWREAGTSGGAQPLQVTLAETSGPVRFCLKRSRPWRANRPWRALSKAGIAEENAPPAAPTGVGAASFLPQGKSPTPRVALSEAALAGSVSGRGSVAARLGEAVFGGPAGRARSPERTSEQSVEDEMREGRALRPRAPWEASCP